MPALTAAQREQFADEGYLVVEDALDPARDIQPVMDEYADVLDGIAAALYTEGAIRATYRGLPFAERLIQVCVESGRNFPLHFDFCLPPRGVRHDTPMHVGPAIFGLLTNSHLLDLVESVIGPEIYSNPIQHIRMKLPDRAVAQDSYSGLISRIPWHQDNGVLLPEADTATILTVWAPITEATLENGCLQVIPRSHRGDLLAHCRGPMGPAIPERLVAAQQARALPLRPGSVLLMTQRTVHCSLDNRTADEVRISFDLRYQPIGQPTGRPQYPGFVARSRADPQQELRDAHAWAQRWYDARAYLAEREDPTYTRWTSGAPLCA